MMTDNKPKRKLKYKVVIPIVAAGGVLIGAVVGNLGRLRTDYSVPSAEAEKTPNVGEIADQPESSQPKSTELGDAPQAYIDDAQDFDQPESYRPTPTELSDAPQAYVDDTQDSGQGEDFLSGLQRYINFRIQVDLNDLKNQCRQLSGELDSLDRKLGSLSRKIDSYGKAAGTRERGSTLAPADLRQLQLNLRNLQESVENNNREIQRITDHRYGQEFVTLSQVESLIRDIPEVSDREIRDVVERTLRVHGLAGTGAYGSMDSTINDIRRDIATIDQSIGDMRRDIDDLKRKVD